MWVQVQSHLLCMMVDALYMRRGRTCRYTQRTRGPPFTVHGGYHHLYISVHSTRWVPSSIYIRSQYTVGTIISIYPLTYEGILTEAGNPGELLVAPTVRLHGARLAVPLRRRRERELYTYINLTCHSETCERHARNTMRSSTGCGFQFIGHLSLSLPSLSV